MSLNQNKRRGCLLAYRNHNSSTEACRNIILDISVIRIAYRWKHRNFGEFLCFPRRQREHFASQHLVPAEHSSFVCAHSDFPATQPLMARPVIYFEFCSYYQKIPWNQIKRSEVLSITADNKGTAEGDAYFSAPMEH